MSDVAIKASAIKASEPLTLRAQLTEDWLAVVIGLLVFGTALVSVSGTDLLGLGRDHVGLHRCHASTPPVRQGLWRGSAAAVH